MWEVWNMWWCMENKLNVSSTSPPPLPLILLTYPSSLSPHTGNFVSSVQCGRGSKRRSWQNCMKDLKKKKVNHDQNEIHSCPPPTLLLLLLKKTFSWIFYGLISMFFLPESYAVGSLVPRTEGLGTRLLAGNLIPET